MGVMKVIEHPGEPEREVVIGMIVNETVAGRVAAAWGEPPGPFSCPAWNLVGRWCVDHYRNYKKPMGRTLQTAFREWAEGKDDRPEVVKVAALLEHLSDQYGRIKKGLNPDYLTDLATRTFRSNRMAKLLEEAQDLHAAGKLDEAEAKITRYAGPDLRAAKALRVSTDPEFMRSMFSTEVREPLVVYPGGLGQFFGHMLGRDQLIAFMAPEKSFKSWCLLDIACTAMAQRRRVAYFQVGDLSTRQIAERFLVRWARQPSLSTNEDGVSWPCTAQWPTAIEAPGAEDDCASVTHKTRTFDKPMQSVEGWEKQVCENVAKITNSKNDYILLECSPSSSVSIMQIRSTLESYALSGYPVDVCVVDYADILLPITSRLDPLHQIRETWVELRKLSQEYHCLLVTATQVNAASYGKKLLDRSNFGGNHLKYAEVTGMVGINIMPEERENQVMRLNWIMKREGAYNHRRCVHVAGCLALSAPWVVSVYPKWGGRKKVDG